MAALSRGIANGDVGDAAGRQCEGDRSAAIVGQAMDLARPAAARAADRFFPLLLFEPAAERCAFTWLLSIDRSSGIGPSAAIFSNSAARCHAMAICCRGCKSSLADHRRRECQVDCVRAIRG